MCKIIVVINRSNILSHSTIGACLDINDIYAMPYSILIMLEYILETIKKFILYSFFPIC